MGKSEIEKIGFTINICENNGINTIQELKQFYEIERLRQFNLLLSKMKSYELRKNKEKKRNENY